MIREIVNYGHPALRRQGKPIDAIDESVQSLVEDLFETMNDAHGIGLAAPQIAEEKQVCVIDVRPVEDRPSLLWIDGEPAEVASIMPLVLINPQLEISGEPVSGPEGCLSFPEIYAEVRRPPKTKVRAQNLDGAPIEFECAGLLSRCVQHEHDHLHGILFIDRMTETERGKIRDEYQELQERTQALMQRRSKS